MPFSLRTLAVFLLLTAPVVIAQQSNDAASSTNNGIAAQDGNAASAQASPTPADATSTPSPTPVSREIDEDKPPVTIKSAVLNLPKDQFAIWTSPAHIHTNDLYWLLPLGGTTGVLLGSDSHSMAREKSTASAVHRSTQISDYGLAVSLGVPAATYLLGETSGSPHERETGILTGEALVDSLIVSEGLKYALQRQRPALSGPGGGDFFSGNGGSGSFPSNHAILAWTAASVFAHEYPGILPEIFSYGLASAVSASRVTARDHFPADVVAGSAMGWLIGRQVYRAHSQLNDAALYGTFERTTEQDREHKSSVYVPIDSWIYPELKRLAGMGYIRTQITGQLPWTEQECLRQLEEDGDLSADLPEDSAVRKLIATLKSELSTGDDYNHYAKIDSVYTRYMNISGEPLRDSYHFGQTIYNDFGRPYDQGNNLITGVTASAVAERFFFYVQGEYEHAPGRPAESQNIQNIVNVLDTNPPVPTEPISATNRFYPLDMYAGVQLGGYAFTFGKESLWLGPTEGAPLMISDNADPMYMFRVARSSPFYLPWFLHALGPISTETYFAKLSGHQYPARPFFNLEKISLHPTKNLEFGVTRASVWAGAGHPFTLRAIEKNLFALGDTTGTFNNINDPGDRKAGFDFSYRLPGLRNWLTVYSDSYCDDDPNPIANPRRSAWAPGLYLSHIPRIPKMDLRFEVASTESLTAVDRGANFLYINGDYHDSNLNKGFLYGNSIGRDARSFQGFTTYHFAPGKTLELSYRQLKLATGMYQGVSNSDGGTQSDASARAAWRLSSDWSLDAFAQYERWLIPVLRTTEQTNFSASLQVTFHPHWVAHD